MAEGGGWTTLGETLLDVETIADSPSYTKGWRNDVGPGWRPILDTLVDLIDWNVKRGKMPPVTILQVKEKFGTLRFYTGGGNEKTDMYVSFAENLSGRVCEDCGAPAGTRSLKGWYRTVCDDHA